jgi:hypothetical protein
MSNEAKRKIAIIEIAEDGTEKVITHLGDYPYSDNGEMYIEDFQESIRLKKSVASFEKSFITMLAEMRIIDQNGFNDKMEVGSLLMLILGALPDKLLMIPKSKLDLSSGMGKAVSFFLGDTIDIKSHINKFFPSKVKYNTTKPVSELFKPLLLFFRENQNYLNGLPEILDKMETQATTFISKQQ